MNVKLPNKRYLAITEIYAFVALQQDGEGIMAFAGINGMMIPMIGADIERVESLKPIADEISATTGIKYEIRYFKADTKPCDGLNN